MYRPLVRTKKYLWIKDFFSRPTRDVTTVLVLRVKSLPSRRQLWLKFTTYVVGNKKRRGLVLGWITVRESKFPKSRVSGLTPIPSGSG